MTPLVHLRQVSKRYGSIVANDEATCAAFAGEVHAVLGENGAGKTTLMRILAGLEQPDSGVIEIDGHAASFRGPRDAMKAGIGMVHQHLSLIPALTVAENLALSGRDHSILYSPKEWRRKIIDKALATGFSIRPDSPVWQLSMGERQRVEVFRLVLQGARILVLDEPTSILSPQEAEQLFEQLKRFAAAGHAILFITHKVRQVKAVADRVTILRRGRVVNTAEAAELDENDLATLMVGTADSLMFAGRSAQTRSRGKTLLSLEAIDVQPIVSADGIRSASLELHAGEILGVAGVSGSGQDEMVAAVTGFAGHRGTITWASQATTRAYIPADRVGVGVAMSLPLADNLSFRNAAQPGYTSGPVLLKNRLATAANLMIEEYAIRGALDSPVATLSGGNIQKAVIARELSRNPSVIIAENPTAGLDIATTRFVQAELAKRADLGAGILLVSEDLDELFALCDRIVVLHEGRIAGTFPTTPEYLPSIAAAMTGARPTTGVLPSWASQPSRVIAAAMTVHG